MTSSVVIVFKYTTLTKKGNRADHTVLELIREKKSSPRISAQLIVAELRRFSAIADHFRSGKFNLSPLIWGRGRLSYERRCGKRELLLSYRLVRWRSAIVINSEQFHSLFMVQCHGVKYKVFSRKNLILSSNLK